MKLYEIFKTEPADNLEADNDINLGAGDYANVYASRSDPHMVNRITKQKKSNSINPRPDAFEIYAHNILSSKIGESNPTFPRIYKRSDGKYQIEKLIPIRDVDLKELYGFMENNFNYSLSDDKGELIADLVMIIQDSIGYGDYSNIKNKSIIDACKWIGKLVVASGTNTDIHAGNIMFRRTQHGIQLVITDPIY